MAKNAQPNYDDGARLGMEASGSDESDLRRTFWGAVGWFNDDNFTLKTDFKRYAVDDEIRMKRLDDPGYHEGIKRVIAYFLGNGNEDKAFFMPDGPPDFIVIGELGFVSGTANFIDKTSVSPPTPTRRIAYSFTYKKKNGEWKGIHMWGKYIDGN